MTIGKLARAGTELREPPAGLPTLRRPTFAAAVDPVPCGPVSRFGRPSTMIREVAYGTDGLSAEVARLLEVSDQSIYTWRRQELIDRGELPGLSSVEREELRVARRRIKELETELAVHRRAAELLKESVRPKGGSQIGPGL